MKPAIILYHPDFPAALVEKLQTHFTVKRFDRFSEANRHDIIAAMGDAVGLIGLGGRIDADFIAHAPMLKAVSTVSVGYDNIDVDALTKKGVAVMHTPTELTETVADTAFALMLATARRVTELEQWIKQGHWKKNVSDGQYSADVHHKTLGIIGMGRIGKAIAKRAYFGFGMPIMYHSRTQYHDVDEQMNAHYCDLDTLLKTADFVCITLPLTSETHHLIDAAALSKMKSSAFLINVGRGSVVDEPALISALQQGQIAGAGLDVFEQEPLAMNSPLLELSNVVMLPHVGSATHETRYQMAVCAADNLIAAIQGDVKKNCVNPEVF